MKREKIVDVWFVFGISKLFLGKSNDTGHITV
jgi:hypothetical protein